MSILSKDAGSNDCFLLDCGLDFCILKEFLVGDGASIGAAFASWGRVCGIACGKVSGKVCGEESMESTALLPQPHVCFLGMAAVTVPQPHA